MLYNILRFQYNLVVIQIGNIRIVKLTFFLVLFLTLTGSRIGSSDISYSIFRSIHFVDLLSIPCFIFCLRYFPKIKKIIGKNLFLSIVTWLIYALIFSAILSPVIFLSEQYSYFPSSLFFWVKDFQYILIFLFAIICSFNNPSFVKNIFLLSFLFLSLWTIKEIIFPTGLYFLGLPFEAGPSQSGIIYALMFVLSLNAIYDKNSLLNIHKIQPKILNVVFRLRFLLPVLLFFGCLASLSRTGIISLIIPLFIFLIFSFVKFIFKLTFSYQTMYLLITISILVLVFIKNGLFDILIPLLTRFGDIAIHLVDRTDKWQELLNEQLLETYTLIFGFGYNSPNQIVLGKSLGNILAVDNGFVRRLFETGIIGILSYSFFIINIQLRCNKLNNFKLPFLVIMTFTFSNFLIESVQTSQTALLFSLSLGSIIGIATFNKKQNHLNQKLTMYLIKNFLRNLEIVLMNKFTLH